MSRKSTGKRLRFEIFKRDSFTCQYCGNQPPEAVLVIDHIQPVSDGGDNDPLNLITACETCNQGKSNKLLEKIYPKPDADVEWLEMQQELAELRRYQIAKAERDRLLSGIIECLQNTWSLYFSDKYAPADVVFLQWLSWSEPDQIEEAIKLGSSKAYKIRNFNDRLKYTAAILHNITGTRKGDEHGES